MNSASAVRDRLFELIQAKNWEELTPLTTPDVLVITPDGHESRGLPALRAALEYRFDAHKPYIKTLQLTPVRESQVSSGRDTATFLAGVVDAKAELPYGLKEDLVVHWSGAFLQDETGDWRLATLHTSVDVFDNPMTTALKSFGVYAALIAALVALFVGYKLGRSGRAQVL